MRKLQTGVKGGAHVQGGWKDRVCTVHVEGLLPVVLGEGVLGAAHAKRIVAPVGVVSLRVAMQHA